MTKIKPYESKCWRCKTKITSYSDKKCNKCGWFCCPNCGACDPNCGRYNKDGYDKDGYNKYGYDKQGYDRKGFDKNKIHKNGTFYDDNDFDFEGAYKYQDRLLNRRIEYKKIYGKGTIKDCYFKEGYLRVIVAFDNGKIVTDISIIPAIRKGLVTLI